VSGRCFAYVFACTWEDHCKVGFSADPLARLQSLHRRWFEFFDLDRSILVETETVADARALELALRRPLVAHRAPVPLTVRPQAGGHSEWLRGARPALLAAVAGLAAGGHAVHDPARPWLQSVLASRAHALYEWAPAQLQFDDAGTAMAAPSIQRLVRDAVDACVALALAIEPLLPPPVLDWYRQPSA
jgi:hypothetical protein